MIKIKSAKDRLLFFAADFESFSPPVSNEQKEDKESNDSNNNDYDPNKMEDTASKVNELAEMGTNSDEADSLLREAGCPVDDENKFEIKDKILAEEIAKIKNKSGGDFCNALSTLIADLESGKSFSPKNADIYKGRLAELKTWVDKNQSRVIKELDSFFEDVSSLKGEETPIDLGKKIATAGSFAKHNYIGNLAPELKDYILTSFDKNLKKVTEKLSNTISSANVPENFKKTLIRGLDYALSNTPKKSMVYAALSREKDKIGKNK